MSEARDLPARCDVAVVGGGPAGLAAATRLRELGAGTVVVLDREPQAGGIPRHCGHYPFGMREFHALLRGPDYARRLVDRAARAGVAIRAGTTVVALEAGPRLQLATAAGLRTLDARRVVLATGVRETSRAARLIGGQRPLGVVSTGALQGMVYLEGLRPFRRPLILGSELVSFSALLTCRHAGIRPVAMVEPRERVTARSFLRALPLLLGVPVLTGCEVLRITGSPRVGAVVVRDAGGNEREIACDGVIVSGRFTPEATLARAGHLAVDTGSGGPVVDQFGRCSDPHYFAAGNLLRPVETAGWSWAEGVRTAAWVAASLRDELPAAGQAVTLAPAGDALRFVLPQRLVTAAPGGMTHAQLRVSRAVRGRLSARVGERVLWSRPVATLPERRLLLPLAPLARAEAGTTVDIDIEEER